jgi:hypothetical protein
VAAAGCSKTAAEEETTNGEAKITAIKGSDVKAVTLTEDANRRLDVQTASATDDGDLTTIPYAAVFYDPTGATWAFTNTDGRRYLRVPITVDHIDGDVAFLTAGPEPGTAVVTVGGPEIYGAEIGVGEEE